MWMKGHASHDLKMEQLLSQNITTVPVVLWPKTYSNDNNNNSAKGSEQEHTNGEEEDSNYNGEEEDQNNSWTFPAPPEHITLIVLEGTWQQASRLLKHKGGRQQQHSLLAKLPRLSISTTPSGGGGQSILAPLRRRTRGMCTAEAVVAACCEASATAARSSSSKANDNDHDDEDHKHHIEFFDSEFVLGWVRRKVNLTRRYKGKPKPPL